MRLVNGDCIQEMSLLPDKSIDMILCDPPYGTTQNTWDVKIEGGVLWEQYRRIIKDNGAIVLFSQLPFMVDLILPARDLFRYEYVWVKKLHTGFLNANRMPMKKHENILVFYKRLPTYNPQFVMASYSERKIYRKHSGRKSSNYGDYEHTETNNNGRLYPSDIIQCGRDKENLHPTQKPVSLCRYLIRTYTNAGDLVLDNCMGSGTTGVACVDEGRDFIGIEVDKHFYDIAKQRITERLKT